MSLARADAAHTGTRIDFMTPTLNVKRKAIEECRRAQIKALYTEH